MSYKHLGSYETITDEAGNLVEKLSFDPWGRRRNPLDWTYDESPFAKTFDRGYTGHQHLDIFGLINMNGRLYDPWLGRMLSPDPFVQAPTYSQNYNRYTYALNNPLKYTDPSGYIYTYGFGGAEDRKLDLRYENRKNSLSQTLWQCNNMAATGRYSSNAPGWGGGGNYVYRGGGIYTKGPDVVSFSEVYNNYIVPNSYTVSDVAAQGMSIYAVSAFGRTTLVSSFGKLGTTLVFSNGAILFSNPSANAYLSEFVVSGQAGGGVIHSDLHEQEVGMGIYGNEDGNDSPGDGYVATKYQYQSLVWPSLAKFGADLRRFFSPRSPYPKGYFNIGFGWDSVIYTNDSGRVHPAMGDSTVYKEYFYNGDKVDSLSHWDYSFPP